MLAATDRGGWTVEDLQREVERPGFLEGFKEYLSGSSPGLHHPDALYDSLPLVKLGDDAEKLIAWLREAADELEKAHAYLDNIGVPRHNPATGNSFTLAARIAWPFVGEAK